MTFDEEINKYKNFSYESYGLYPIYTNEDIYMLLEELKKEYASTIEMTKTQCLFITSEYEQKNIVDAVANLTVDEIIKEKFHKSFWEPLSQREVVQAWLHPETIKVVDK